MKNNLVLVVFCLCFNLGFTQVKAEIEEVKKEVNIVKVENFIVHKQLDSSKIYVSKLKKISSSNYVGILERIIDGTQSHKDDYKFASKLNNRATNNIDVLIKFVDDLPVPSDSQIMALDYVYTNWLLITKLRNTGRIDEATRRNQLLKKYVSKFDKEDDNVEKANLLISNHQIVLFLIEKNIKDGKSLCLDGLESATNLNDNTLRIIFLNLLCDFLILERNLDGYIENSELSLSLESESEEKSPYYIQTLEKLVDAYLFKGGNDKRVNEILKIIFQNPGSKAYSYSLYANFLKSLDVKSQFTNEIFSQFNVDGYISFCDSIEKLGENVLNPNEFYFVLDHSSQLLEAKGFLKKSIEFKSKCVHLTRKIYSEDLSNSLANYRTKQAIKDKELEILHQKEKSSLYLVIIILTAVVLLSLIFVILKKFKQQKILKAKNEEIKLQRDAIIKKEKEKDLLLKEVHHRVKNNFQIVSSLLELQTKGIEDEKALELANDGKNRVKSMALIHQKLYQNEDGLINFDEYIKLLVKELSAMYGSNKQINTSVNSENMMFDVDTAIPLGLIINELITNAYKYAFNNNSEKSLNISIDKRKDDFYKLVVSDNGPGLDSSINLKKVKSLGLRLVTRLVKQLQGSINQSNVNGANFEVLFKDTNLRRLVE